jgi:hypothetical protein
MKIKGLNYGQVQEVAAHCECSRQTVNNIWLKRKVKFSEELELKVMNRINELIEENGKV